MRRFRVKSNRLCLRIVTEYSYHGVGSFFANFSLLLADGDLIKWLAFVVIFKLLLLGIFTLIASSVIYVSA